MQCDNYSMCNYYIICSLLVRGITKNQPEDEIYFSCMSQLPVEKHVLSRKAAVKIAF